MSHFKNAFWSNESLKYEHNFFEVGVDGLSVDDLNRFDQRMYANFFNRTGLIFSTKEYKFNKGIQERRDGESVRVACISSDIRIPEDIDDAEPDLMSVECRDGCLLLAPNPNMRSADWTAMRLNELREAVKGQPDVICFSELAYPPPEAPRNGQPTPDYISSYGKHRAKYERDALEILEEESLEAFTFLGSYHCLQSLYNVGVIFPLGYQAAVFDVATTQEPLVGEEVIDIDIKSISPPINYIKRFPARRAGEETRVPAGNLFEIYETKIGRVAILICSDIVDLNQFLFIARRNLTSNREPIDIVLVPSFNTSERLRSMCRELSYLANTVVVNVNANDRDERFPDTSVSVCGFDLSQLPDEYYGIDRREIRHPGAAAKSSTVVHVTLEQGIQKLRDLALKSHPAEHRGVAGNLRPVRK